jgi:hypothetical protein
MSSVDIVAYTYQADLFCPGCAAAAVGWNKKGGFSAANDFIEAEGKRLGYNMSRMDSFDSGDFPKLVFDYQLEDRRDRCGSCRGLLI